MIINTGGRTDIVRYYSEWLLNRFEEGYVLSRNPLFQNKVTRYELTPEKVDCIEFCSKNYEPILSVITKITDRFNTYFNYTITPYGKDIEPGVPSVDESINTLRKLSAIVGKKRVAWRYDPVLLTEKYTPDTHIRTFEYMTKELAPYVDRCVFNFVEMHNKLKINMPELISLTDDDKKMIAAGCGEIAARYGMRIQACSLNGDYSDYGVISSGCMTLQILGDANGIDFKNLKHKGARAGCQAIENRDIGAYDTCLSGCKYCYATKHPEKSLENYKNHAPQSPLLVGNIRPTDTISQGSQKTFIKK